MRLKFLFLFLGPVIALVIIFFLILPSYKAILVEQEKLAIAEQTLAETLIQKESFDALSADIASHPDEVSDVYSFLPEALESEEAINMIGFISAETSVLVSDVAVEKARKNAKETESTEELSKKPFSVSVSVIGKYEDIKQFVSRFHTIPRDYAIRDFSLVSSEEVEGDARIVSEFLELTFTADFYSATKYELKNREENPIYASNNTSELLSTDKKSFDFMLLGEYFATFVYVPAIQEFVGSALNPFLPRGE